MKKQMLVVAAVLISCMAIAQPEPPKPPTPDDRLSHFTERLDKEVRLNADQKRKVVDAYRDFFAGMDQLHVKYAQQIAPPPPPPPPPAPPVEMKKDMDKLMAEKDGKIKSLLTEEQFKRLKEIDNRHRPERPDAPPPPPPIAPAP